MGSNEKTLKEAIDLVFRNFNINTKIAETRLIQSWEKVMGKPIANHTTKLFINRSTLFIYLDNPALKNELSYAREKIIKMLNEEAGEELIKDVVIK